MITNNLIRLRDEFKNVEFECEPAYFIGGTMHGSKNFVARELNVTAKQVDVWERRGFERSQYSLPKMILYDIGGLKQWHKNNINQSFSTRVASVHDEKPEIDEDNPFAHLDLDDVPKVEAERRKEIEAVKKLQTQNKALEGEYISIDDVDRDMASLAVMMMASLKNHEKSAPSLLANKSSEYILKEITKSHFAVTDKLDRLIHKEFDCDETIYEVMREVINAIDDGKSPKDIIDGFK